LRRAVILFGLGLFLATFSYFVNGSLGKLGFSEWLHSYLTTVRIPGVLQRIAVCYLIAIAIYLWADRYRQISITVGLLVVYWLLMKLAPYSVIVNGEIRYATGLLEQGNNFSAFVDNLVLNGPAIGTHVWSSTKTWDPEGIVSTLPAIATCMLGIFAGELLRTKRTDAEKTAWLMVAGVILMWLGEWMNLWLPINKKIWTSSYAVFMGGLAAVCFGVCYWLLDVQGWRRAAKPLAIYGMNAIAVFVLSGLLGRVIGLFEITPSNGKSVDVKTWSFNRLSEQLGNPKLASLLMAIVWVLLLYFVAWLMYRKKWFVKF
jgi:predicted acyltransferase